jgi:DNA-binding SARP family transcriptional activator
MSTDVDHLRFDILGPLRVRAGRETIAVNAQKLQILLALLLIHNDQVVSIEQLTAQIWGDRVPRRARAGVHVYVSQLRKLLAPGDTGQENPLQTRSPGYVLATKPGDLDLHVFQNLADQGRLHAQAHRHEEAVECFEAALRLWRGPALNGLRECAAVDAFATWLEEIRLRCTELSIESSLHLGRHHDVIGSLYTLTTDHPLREAFHRQLMLALYRAERRAEALAAYRTAREQLRQDLGLEPCHALQELHRSILLGDDRLAVEAA